MQAAASTAARGHLSKGTGTRMDAAANMVYLIVQHFLP